MTDNQVQAIITSYKSYYENGYLRAIMKTDIGTKGSTIILFQCIIGERQILL